MYEQAGFSQDQAYRRPLLLIFKKSEHRVLPADLRPVLEACGTHNLSPLKCQLRWEHPTLDQNWIDQVLRSNTLVRIPYGDTSYIVDCHQYRAAGASWVPTSSDVVGENRPDIPLPASACYAPTSTSTNRTRLATSNDHKGEMGTPNAISRTVQVVPVPPQPNVIPIPPAMDATKRPPEIWPTVIGILHIGKARDGISTCAPAGTAHHFIKPRDLDFRPDLNVAPTFFEPVEIQAIVDITLEMNFRTINDVYKYFELLLHGLQALKTQGHAVVDALGMISEPWIGTCIAARLQSSEEFTGSAMARRVRSSGRMDFTLDELKALAHPRD